MTLRVAVVTGSNRGIGLAIVRSLCQHLKQNGVVYLTARDEGRGQDAVALLQKEGLSPRFYILDVTNQTTIDKFRDHVKEAHGGIDILINNAGVYNDSIPDVFERETFVLGVNFTGVLAVSRALIPLVRSHGRIVHVASTAANVAFNQLGEHDKNRFREASTEENVETLMNEFLLTVKAGGETDESGIKGSNAYRISKLAVVVLSRIQAADIAKDKTRQDILVNSCCPGYVLTDMTAHLAADRYGGKRVTPMEGADTPVYLALLDPEMKQPNGRFLLRRQIYDFMETDMIINI